MKTSKNQIIVLIIISALFLFLCLALLLASCAKDPGVASDSSSTQTEAPETAPDPVYVECDAADYSSYLLPVKETGDGDTLQETAQQYAADGIVHLRVYDSTGVAVGETVKPKEIYKFTDFISIGHGEYETPYIFRGGKDLKIILGAPGEIIYRRYYVTSPAVFGAFEDIILPLGYSETDEKLGAVPEMIYVEFEYDGQRYCVFRDGTAWCGDKKSENRLTAEQFALFAAYKYAYSYAADERTDNYGGFSTQPGETNTVVISESGGKRVLTGEDALGFLKKCAAAPDDQGLYTVSSKYRCDVNPTGNIETPSFCFAVCKDGETDISEDSTAWYSVFGDGRITRRGRWTYEREYVTGVFDMFCVPMTQISSGLYDFN